MATQSKQKSRKSPAARKAEWWKDKKYTLEAVQVLDFDNQPYCFEVRGKSTTPTRRVLAVVFTAPYRTPDQASELAKEIAKDPDVIDALPRRGEAGVIDRRRVDPAEDMPMIWPDPWLPPSPRLVDSDGNDPEYWDAYEEVENLAPGVSRVLSAADPAKRIFQHGWPDRGYVDNSFLPALDGLYAAIAAFARLPEETQEKALEGWHYDPPWKREEREDVLREVHDGTVRVFAKIDVDNKGGIARSRHGVICDDITSPLRVAIMRGTHKHEALAWLDEVRAHIERNWWDITNNHSWREAMKRDAEDRARAEAARAVEKDGGPQT